MKKILTVLLSFLMVATLGVVNVNTVSAETAEEGIPVYGDSKIEVTRATNVTYDGGDQTVFTLKCVDRTDKDKGSATATCHYKYAVSTDVSPDKTDLDWKTSATNDKDKEIYVTAKDAGTYYLHVAMFKTDGSGDIQQYNTYGYNKETGISSMSVTIAKANAPKVTINAPTSATGSDEEHGEVYFVTKESGTVTLPFTKTSNPVVETRWDDAVIKVAMGNTEDEYPTNTDGKISFDKDNGELTIKASESVDQITYVVTLKAYSDSSNYEKSEGTKTVCITKVKSDDFTIKFDELSTDSDGDVIFGLTGNEILDKISSVGLGNSSEESGYYQLAPKEGVTTITSKKIEKKNNGTWAELKNTELKNKLNVGSDYRVSVTVTHQYGSGEGQSYTYVATDEFSIVKKDAIANVKAKENLVYSGNDQTLVKLKKITYEPSEAGVAGYKVVKKTEGSSVTTGSITEGAYNAVEEKEVQNPKGTDVGTYYVYYHVSNGGNANYNDGYYVLEAKIAQKPILDVTVTTPEDVTYNGTEQKQEPVVKDGEKVLTKDTDYTLSYSEDTTNVGTVTVTITGKGNYANETTTSYKITKKSIKGETFEVTAPSDATYNGAEQKQEPVVKDGEKVLTKDTDYTLSYSEDTTNAGKVTVTVKGVGNYKHEVTTTYTIKAKELTVSGLTDTTVTYDGQSHKPTVTVNGLVDADEDLAIVTYASDEKAYINAGTWTTNVAIPLGNNNYVFAEGTETSATLTINKAESKIVASATQTTYYKNNGGRATLKADGLLADFKELQVYYNGKWETVDSSNYYKSEGSTVVLLRQTYLQSKTADGKDRFEYDKDYTFRFVYDSNYSNAPETTLKIRKYTAPSNNSSSSSSTTTKKVVNTATH